MLKNNFVSCQSGTAAKTQSACVDIVSLASFFDIKSNIKSNLKLSAQSVSDKKKSGLIVFGPEHI